MTQTIPDTMQAAAIDRFGGIDEIKLQTLPVPEVGPDEVLIRVESIGVGVWDPWEREGLFHELFRERYGVEPTFPYVIGFDRAGASPIPRGIQPEPEARTGVAVNKYVGDDASPEVIEKLNRLIASGPFEVHVARSFPLEQAAEAHRVLDEHYLGKLALRPN